MTYAQALNSALREEMRRDERVVVLGEDVARYGGMFRVTAGLLEEFGSGRVVDTPISENGIVGAAVGMAMGGLRPVVEIMHADFLALAMDSLANGASVLPFVYGEQVSIPLVVRTQGGAGANAGPQHSKSLEAWTAYLPGLHTVLPATPANAKGLLTSAVRANDPVVLLEHKLLYRKTGEVPDGEHVVPLGSASVVRPGTDATVIALSRTLGPACAAAATLAADGIDVEVVDVRSLRPLDLATLAGSVLGTGRAVVVTEAWTRFGPAAEIAAAVTEAAFHRLMAPVVRLGCVGAPIPASPALESGMLPNAAAIERAVTRLCRVTERPHRADPVPW